MSLTTFFQFTHTSHLPLPPPATQRSDSPTAHETSSEITTRGISTALAMLHSPDLMITLNPLVQHYTRINPFELNSENHLVDLQKLAPAFNVTLATSPNVAKFEDSKEGEFVHYEIVDKFQFLGGLTSKLMTYRACFRPLYASQSRPNTSTSSAAESVSNGRQSIGLETISDPGSGVSLLGKWVVREGEGELVLEETVSVHCNVLLGWYVKGQLESAHAALHKEFGRWFVEKMKKGVARDERAGKTWHESRRKEGGTSQPVSRVGTDEL